MSNQLLSIVINYKTNDLLSNFIDSYMEYVHDEGRILVIGDVDGDYPISLVPDGVGFIGWNENIGYARAVNYIARAYESYNCENIGIFNADTRFVNYDCVDSCVNLLQSEKDIGVVGPLQYNGQGQITHAGIFGRNSKPLHRAWKSKDLASVRDVKDAVTVSGSAYFVKRSVWDQLANDPEFLLIDPEAEGAFLTTNLYYEETFCSYFARHKGYRVVYNGLAEMLHEHDSSPESELVGRLPEAREKFRAACDALGIERD